MAIPKQFRQVMTLSQCFYILLGIVFAPIVYLLAPRVTHLFSMPEHLRRTIEVSIFVMFMYFILLGIISVFSARLVSLHRMNITASITLIGQIVYGALVVVVIPISPTVLTAVWLSLDSTSYDWSALVCYRPADRRTPLLQSSRDFPKALIRKLFAFGGWMQLNSLTALVNLEADKIIIAGFLNMAAVTPYQIGNRLASPTPRSFLFSYCSRCCPAATICQWPGPARRPSESFATCLDI